MSRSLAERAVACKGWRWMPGMLTNRAGWRVVDVSADWLAMDDLMGSGRGFRPSEVLPDLNDPATLGCLLALVREAWGKPTWAPRFLPWLNHWAVEASDTWGHTEAEALVAALEAGS